MVNGISNFPMTKINGNGADLAEKWWKKSINV